MCTYITERLALGGTAISAGEWFSLTDATVYFDHPQHAPFDHSLNIDFLDLGSAPRRVGVELEPAGALELARRILAVLAALPEGMAPEGEQARRLVAAWGEGQERRGLDP